MTDEALALPELDTPAERKDLIVSVAGQIANLSTGDRAALRRMYLTKGYDADGLVIGLLHRAKTGVTADSKAFAAWRLVAHVAALLSGTAGGYPHTARRRVGAALQAVGYSENRLLRLTAARGPALQGQIVRAARMLAQGGERTVDLWTVLDLAGSDRDKAEAARIRIAQDYYTAQARSEGDTK